MEAGQAEEEEEALAPTLMLSLIDDEAAVLVGGKPQMALAVRSRDYQQHQAPAVLPPQDWLLMALESSAARAGEH